MNTNQLLQKLHPLVPDKVKAWRRIRDTSDPDMIDLIDKEIAHQAYQLLGDFNDKLFLSLPPPSLIKGKIELGTVVYNEPKWIAGLEHPELMQNLGIFGRSGAGKTNVAFLILNQLIRQKIPFVFLDWKRTARHLIPSLKAGIKVYTPGRNLSPFIFNPFVVPKGIEPTSYINHVVDVLASAYTLGDGAKSIVQNAIASCYRNNNHSPNVAEVIQQVERIEAKERVRGWKITALRALQSIEQAGIANVKTSQEEMITTLIKGNTIIELDALSQNVKDFLVPLLCQWIYQVKLSTPIRETLDLVVFIEEAHHVLYRNQNLSRESVMEMFLRQCREIGIGTIIIDQQPHLISSTALANIYTSICLNQKSPSDINKAASISLLDTDEKSHLSLLKTGQGIIKMQDRWVRPFLVNFPLVKIKKGLIADDKLTQYFSQSGLPGLILSQNTTSDPLDTSNLEALLDGNSWIFLKDVAGHRDDSVTDRYKRLKFNPAIGNRIKATLLDSGLIEQQIVDYGKTRKVLLRLTPAGKEAIGLAKSTGRNESIVHEYWKRFYAKKYQDLGYEVKIEAPRKSGYVDVLATKGKDTVAIEIETGKSNIVRNVMQNLTSGFSKVLVVAVDDKAFDIVQIELAKVGLLGVGRVEVMVRDKT